MAKERSLDPGYLQWEQVSVVDGAAGALDHLRSRLTDIVVIDLPLAGCSAADLIRDLHQLQASLPVIVRSPDNSLPGAIELIKAGAFHVIDRDAPGNELKAAIGAALNLPPAQTRMAPAIADNSDAWRRDLAGDSPAMEALAQFIRLAGPRRCTVLISGETGTGKELVARALHRGSPRVHLPMIAVNCAALPEHLLEAELFGHVRGAFTGAVASRIGRIEQAHRGTLFLDEIADLPLDLQAKLLRVLQEREVQRLGSSETIRVDVRIIAACNVDLLDRVRTGRFREDLYYRLAVVPVTVPPLRDRSADIPALAEHFIQRISANEGLPPKRLTPEALDALTAYTWPGNVRQLENSLEMAMVLSGDRALLHSTDFHLPPPLARHRTLQEAPMPLIDVPDQGLDFERIVGNLELNLLEQALRKTNGNKKQAAEMLGLKRTTLSAKLKTFEGWRAVYEPERAGNPPLSRASTLT